MISVCSSGQVTPTLLASVSSCMQLEDWIVPSLSIFPELTHVVADADVK